MDDSANSGKETALATPDEGMAGQPPAGDVAAANFRRLTGHARLIGSGIVAGAKLSAFAFLGFIWFGTVQGGRHLDAGTLVTLGILAAAAVITCHALVAPARWRALWSAITTLACAAECVLVQWATLPLTANWFNIDHVVACAGPILLGGLIGHLLASASRAVSESAAVTGQFSSVAPLLGLDPRGPGYRADVEAFFAVVEQSVTNGLIELRMLSLCGIAVLVLSVTVEWGQSLTDDLSPWHIWDSWDVAGWLVFGVIIGTVCGATLLPVRLGKMALALPAGLAGLIAVGTATGVVLAGHVRFIAAAVSPMLEVAITVGLAAAGACLIPRFFAGVVLRRILPAPIAAHIVGPSSPRGASEPPRAVAALACEMCGYPLEGLPTSICPTCNTEELRCPECGHQQPATTLHARTVMRICRIHLAIRIASWLAAIGLTGLLLFVWYVLGGVIQGTFISRELLIFTMMSCIFVAPLRLLFLHWRPPVATSLFVPTLPLLAMYLGAWFLRRSPRSPQIDLQMVAFVAMWLLASLLAPFLWQGLLWLMFGSQSRDVWRWQTSRAYRRGDASRMIGEARAIGTDFAAGQTLAPCSACGVLHGEPAGPVSLARIAFEGLVHRTRQMLLVLIAAAIAAGWAIAAITLVGFGSTFRYMGAGLLDRGELTPLIIAALCAGALVRGMMIRWRIIESALSAGAFATFWFIISFLCDSYDSTARPSLVFAMCAMVMMAAFIGALLLLPALALPSRLFMPTSTAKALMAWLRGEATLDAAAESLPVCSQQRRNPANTDQATD